MSPLTFVRPAPGRLSVCLAGALLLLPTLGRAQNPALEKAQEREELEALRDSMRRGELREVEGDLREFVLDFPESAPAELLLLEVESRLGRYPAALRRVERLGERADYGDLEIRFCELGFDLYDQLGRPEEAGALLERGLSARGDVASLLSRKVQMLAENGRRQEAVEARHRMPSVVVGPDGDPDLLLEHSRARAALGDLELSHRCAVFAEKTLFEAKAYRQAEALLRMGDGFRQARSEDGLRALQAYRDALEIDAGLSAAHMGIARTYVYRMENDKAEREVEKARSINLKLPAAFAVKSELLLYQRAFREALEEAEAGLEVNPRHRPLLAVRATALSLLADRDGEKVAIEAMLAVDSRYADGFRLIGDLNAFHYRFAEAIPYYERGKALDPRFALTYFGLARCLANTGHEEEALAQLDRFRELDEFRFPWAHNLQTALRTVSRLARVQRGRFHFLVDPLESPVLVPLLADLYRERWKDFTRRYDLEDDDEPIQVEIFSVHNDFSARTVGFTGFGAVGVCFGHTLTLVSPRSELRGSFQFERTAVHELAHVVSLYLSNQRVPRWLTEGMSVWEESVFAPYCDREMDLDLYNYFHSGEIIPVAKLNRLFAGPKVLFGYYQSGLLCRYIVGHHGQKALVSLLRGYAEEKSTPQIIEEVLGMDTEELDWRFLSWLETERIASMNVQPTYTGHGRRRLRDRLEESDGKPPADLLTQIAWAYHQAGRQIDRDSYLVRAVKSDPDHASLQFLLAERALQKERFPEARRLYERGFDAGGEEFFALLRYAELVREQDGDGEEVLERVLEIYGRAKHCFARYVGPGSPYLQRAKLLRMLEREEEALDEMRQYCAIHESDQAPRWFLVEQALERNDYAEASKYLRELRAVDPFQRELHRQLATCQRSLSDSTGAIASLKLAMAVDPETEPGYDPRIPEEARRVADRRERAEILLDLAEIYSELGENDSARQALEDSRQLQAEDSPRADELEQRLKARTQS